MLKNSFYQYVKDKLVMTILYKVRSVPSVHVKKQ